MRCKKFLSVILGLLTALQASFANAVTPTVTELTHRFNGLYDELLKTLDYDEETGKILQREGKKLPIAEQFELDLREIKRRKRGVCRQIATLLCFELDKIGIPSRLILMELEDGEFHLSVMYKMGTRWRFADLTNDVDQKRKTKRHPMWRNVPIGRYIKLMSPIKEIYYVTKHPKNIHAKKDFKLKKLCIRPGTF